MNISLGFPEPPAADTPGNELRKPAGLEGALARFQEWAADENSPIRAIRLIPARNGEYVPMPEEVSAAVQRGLERRGIKQLYIHQADAFEKIAQWKNVVVVTPTASGKTLYST